MGRKSGDRMENNLANCVNGRRFAEEFHGGTFALRGAKDAVRRAVGFDQRGGSAGPQGMY